MGKRQPLFVIVREAECEALKGLSANAVKLWVAIRYGRREDEAFPIGCRDFGDWGLSRNVVARALQELQDAGLLNVMDRGAFGRRGKRTVYAIVHTKAFEREQSRQRDNKIEKSPASVTTNVKTVPQAGQQTRKESLQRDTPKDTSSTSSQKSKEEEVSVNSEAEAERLASITALREKKKVIGEAADQLGCRIDQFEEKSGGIDAAHFLALKLRRGNLTLQQLRKRLAESEAGALEEEDEGPTVFAVAIGGAF